MNELDAFLGWWDSFEPTLTASDEVAVRGWEYNKRVAFSAWRHRARLKLSADLTPDVERVRLAVACVGAGERMKEAAEAFLKYCDLADKKGGAS